MVSAATAGTDYAPATSGTSILKANGSGGFSNASFDEKAVLNTLNTGLLTTGTLVTVNGSNPAKFDIAPFKCRFVNNSDPQNPTLTYYDYAGSAANIVTNLATWPITYLTLDSTGTIKQYQTVPTGATLRDEVVL